MNNNDLDMGLFSDSPEIELNIGEPLPEGAEQLEGTPQVDDSTNTDPVGDETPAINKNINSGEGESPEGVAGEEDSEGSSEGVTSPNLYSSFASELHDKGVLPSLDLENNKINGTDDLASLIKNEIDTQTKAFLLEKVGEEGLDALEKGISLAEYQQHQNAIQSLDGITEEALKDDLDLAQRVIYQDYINQGLDERRAKRIIQKTIDLGEEAILEDATESIKSLRDFEIKRIEYNKEQNIKQEAVNKKHQEKIDNDLKHAIYDKKEFIKGIPANKAIQDDVYKAITTIVGEDPDGVMENQLMRDRRENPIEFDSKLYYLYQLTNGFNDFTKLVGKATSKATSDFERVLRQQKFETGGEPSFLRDGESYDGLGSELVI